MRVIKFILILAVLYLAPQVSYCQYFQRLHDCDTASDFGTNVLILPDGSYLSFSASLSYTTNRRESSWMNVSADGTTLSNLKQIASDTFNYYQGLNPGEVKELDGGSFLLPCNLRLNGKSALGIVKLSSQLDTVFTRFYTDTNVYNEDISACIVMPNGDFVLGGYSAPNGVFMDSAIIIRTDSLGNLIWKRKYKKIANQESMIISLQAIGDTILVGAASTYYIWANQFDQYNHSSPWFMLVDGTGVLIKDTLYNGAYAAGGRIYKDAEGGYYHWGGFDSLYYSQDILNPVNFPEYLMHLNEDFEIDWVRNFGTWDGHKYIWRVKQLANGDFQLSGANALNLDPRRRGWAARLDHNGWTIWDNDYTCDEDYSSYLVDFDVRQDGSLILVGAARNDTVPQWRGQELWMVSVDSNGCLIAGCAPTIVKPLEQKKEEELLVYPNPTNGNFIAESSGGRLSLMSIDGRVLKEYKLKKGKERLELPESLAAGVYMIKYKGAEIDEVLRLIYQR